MKRLNGRVALVTGSGHGMGVAIARALGSEGAIVIVTGTKKELVDKTAASFREEGLAAEGYAMNVTDEGQVAEVFQAVKEKYGRFDILVNNAGGALNTPYKLDEIREADWDLVLNVNLKGTFFCCREAIKIMAKQGGGSIVNISALAAHYRASLAGVQYTAAKAGVEGLTRQLAYDWGDKGIRVTAVAPTITMTGDRIQGLWDAKSKEEQDKNLRNIPLKRLGKPEEIAAAVVFLASDEASYVTGITLDVSGGRYLR